MYEKYPLAHADAKTIHNTIINDDNGYSLTITLNPKFNHLPVHEQYNKFSRELKQLFKELDPYYKTVMINFEFTKVYNIHAHVYYISECEYIVFDQNYKRCCQKYMSIGKNYKLKKIDEVSPELIEYPFKDCERTTKYSRVDNCLFNPFHYVKRVSNLGSLRSPKVGHIDISKFMDFVNSTKII